MANFLSNLLKGKEKTYHADPLAGAINKAGKSGMDSLISGGQKAAEFYNEDPTASINSQVGIENKLMRGASEDAARRTRSLIASRGMGSSSIGLGQEAASNRLLSDRLAMNTAGGMERLRDRKLQNAQGLMQTGQTLLAPKLGQGPIQMQKIKQRQGGMAGLIGAGVGAYFGGPAGAKVGMAAGDAYANS